MIDRASTIVSRAFEAAYQERDTAASIVASLQPADPTVGSSSVAGQYLTARLSVSDRLAAPGHRLSLIADVTPGTDIHVYAPGQKGYIAIELKLDPSADFKGGAVRFPSSREYYFAPLNERVQVFDRPFRILQDVTLALTPSLRQRATAKESLTITGTLEYQACDDKVCYRPDSVPLKWTIGLTPIERQPSAGH